MNPNLQDHIFNAIELPKNFLRDKPYKSKAELFTFSQNIYSRVQKNDKFDEDLEHSEEILDQIKMRIEYEKLNSEKGENLSYDKTMEIF